MALIDIRGQAKRRTPDELIKHLNSFELEFKFSAGVWFFFTRRRALPLTRTD
jgi:xylose isomerase